MENYQEAFDKIKTAVEGMEMLQKAAFKQYSFLDNPEEKEPCLKV